MKLTPSNISSIAAIPNGSIIKKVDDNNFAEVTASDIGALGIVNRTLVAGNTYYAYGPNVTTIIGSEASYTQKFTRTVQYGGEYRMEIRLNLNSGGNPSYAQIRKNGVSLGTVTATNATFQVLIVDVTCNVGDTLEAWAYSSLPGSTFYGLLVESIRYDIYDPMQHITVI